MGAELNAVLKTLNLCCFFIVVVVDVDWWIAEINFLMGFEKKSGVRHAGRIHIALIVVISACLHNLCFIPCSQGKFRVHCILLAAGRIPGNKCFIAPTVFTSYRDKPEGENLFYFFLLVFCDAVMVEGRENREKCACWTGENLISVTAAAIAPPNHLIISRVYRVWVWWPH